MKNPENKMKSGQNGAFYIVTVLTGEHAGKKVVMEDITQWDGTSAYWEGKITAEELSSCPGRVLKGGTEIFTERIVEEQELVICGAGHVSLEIAALADYMGYPYTVLDDREEFITKERFPNARERICGEFKEGLDPSRYSANAYYIIVTRGHVADLVCLEQVLSRHFGYAGMIGSRGKVKKSMEAMREKGFGDALLSRVHTPIGLPIGGQTPKEIALSIMAEIVQVKNQEQPSSYFDSEMAGHLKSTKGMAMAVIVDKKGSAPRGVGSRMLVDEHGLLAGTIGGGIIEYQVLKEIRALVGTRQCIVKNYQLNEKDAAALGMWCGGELEVLMEGIPPKESEIKADTVCELYQKLSGGRNERL